MYTNRNIPAPFYNPATQLPQEQPLAENRSHMNTEAVPPKPKKDYSTARQSHFQSNSLLALLLLCCQQKE